MERTQEGKADEDVGQQMTERDISERMITVPLLKPLKGDTLFPETACKSLMAEWLEQPSQWHEEYCHKSGGHEFEPWLGQTWGA